MRSTRGTLDGSARMVDEDEEVDRTLEREHSENEDVANLQQRASEVCVALAEEAV